MSTQRTQEQDQLEQATGQGANPAPTRNGISARTSAPAEYATSGMEKAMGDLADKIHKPIKRR